MCKYILRKKAELVNQKTWQTKWVGSRQESYNLCVWITEMINNTKITYARNPRDRYIQIQMRNIIGEKVMLTWRTNKPIMIGFLYRKCCCSSLHFQCLYLCATVIMLSKWEEKHASIAYTIFCISRPIYVNPHGFLLCIHACKGMPFMKVFHWFIDHSISIPFRKKTGILHNFMFSLVLILPKWQQLEINMVSVHPSIKPQRF